MSVVTEEVLNIALIAYHRTRPHEGAVVAMRAALAAVAPFIAAAERERCARVADREADTQRIVRGRQTEDWEYLQKQDAKTEVAENIAAVIRAMGDEPEKKDQ